jgi:hypothetical protein
MLQKYLLSNETHPIAYTAKKLKGAQLTYSAYDTELLAICIALKEWRHSLEGCSHFIVITDHTTLRQLLTQPYLDRKQASWSQVISPYLNKIAIIYRKGSQMTQMIFLVDRI